MEVKIQIPDNCELIKDGDTYIVKEKKQEPPRSWEEFCKSHPIKDTEYFMDGNSNIRRRCTFGIASREVSEDKNLCSSEEEAEAFLALMQLRQLRKVWIGDWKEKDSNRFACIKCGLSRGLYVCVCNGTSNSMSFPNDKIAEDFLNCFRDLCETAKILL